jgi:hypothetical protein
VPFGERTSLPNIDADVIPALLADDFTGIGKTQAPGIVGSALPNPIKVNSTQPISHTIWIAALPAETLTELPVTLTLRSTAGITTVAVPTESAAGLPVTLIETLVTKETVTVPNALVIAVPVAFTLAPALVEGVPTAEVRDVPEGLVLAAAVSDGVPAEPVKAVPVRLTLTETEASSSTTKSQKADAEALPQVIVVLASPEFSDIYSMPVVGVL